jgi:hypothetical protein
MLGDKVQGSALVNDFPFNDLFALWATFRSFFSFINETADRADEFLFHSCFPFY